MTMRSRSLTELTQLIEHATTLSRASGLSGFVKIHVRAWCAGRSRNTALFEADMKHSNVNSSRGPGACTFLPPMSREANESMETFAERAAVEVRDQGNNAVAA
jgi:hypothetical protein